MLQLDLNNKILYSDMETIYQGVDVSELKNKKVYITGASGMIASYLVLFLIWLNEYREYNIRIYAGIRNEKKARAKFGGYLEKDYFKIVSQDVVSPVCLDDEIDYIVHAASLASPQFYGKYPVETMLPNIVGTYELLEYSKKNKIKSFLFFSSGEVYGDVSADIELITEDIVGKLDYLYSGNVYGESKRCGEVLCTSYFKEFNVPINIARIYHSYGPTMDIEGDTRVFSEFVSNIIQNKNIVMKSNGTTKRAFCYMTDTLTGILKILLSNEFGQCFNVGNDEQYISISDLANKLVNLYPAKNLKVIYELREEEGYKARIEPRQVKFSTYKLRCLGWKPKVSVSEGFCRTIDGIGNN